MMDPALGTGHLLKKTPAIFALKWPVFWGFVFSGSDGLCSLAGHVYLVAA